MTYSKSSKRKRELTQNPARESDELLKIKQEKAMTYSKSSKRERGVIQNPAREREEVFKIQQERERELFKIQQLKGKGGGSLLMRSGSS